MLHIYLCYYIYIAFVKTISLKNAIINVTLDTEIPIQEGEASES